MRDASRGRPAPASRRSGRRDVRQQLSSAAIRLFLDQGYDETTVDEIAEAAGVARRTFFRYFRTKDDAVFPDHDECLTRVEAFVAGTDVTEPPLIVLRGAARLVLAMYAEDPATAVSRYELVRKVESLREREITTTSRYQRVFAEFLHRRLGGGDSERLLQEAAAATVVAAHNFVLRQWLRDGGTGDVAARLDHALRTIGSSLPGWLQGNGVTPLDATQDEVLLLVARPGTPHWRIVQEIQAATSPPDPEKD